MKYPIFKKIYNEFQENIKYFPKGDKDLFKKAYRIARKEHQGQKKFGLYSYIIHPLSVFNFIFKKLHITNPNILISALLHDTVEDGTTTLNDIKRIFGNNVFLIVKTVTRIAREDETEEEKKILKMKHFNDVVCKGSQEAKILGIADKYDNLKNIPCIPIDSPHYKKFSRWFNETESFIVLAKKTSEIAFQLLRSELVRVKNLVKF